MPTLFDLFGCRESYELPDKIMAVLTSEDAPAMLDKIRAAGITDLRDFYQTDAGDRDRLKQDFTPDAICQIVARLMLPGDYLDMCAGTGALSKAAFKAGHGSPHMQEFSSRTIAFNLLDSALNGMDGIVEEADCLRGTVARCYRIASGRVSEEPPEETGTYQNVIMNPPYSMSFPDANDYFFYGYTVPTSKADYGFILRGVSHLKEGGRLIAVVPHGLLFRGAKEGKIREYLCRNRLIRAVIGLPDHMFLNTDIPVCLMILQKESDGILFIDASKEFEKHGRQNDMAQDQIDHVVRAFETGSDVERYAHRASSEEVEGNEFNLNIPRYVDSYIPEPLPDMKTLLDEYEQIESELRTVGSDLAKTLRELTGPASDVEQIRRFAGILEREAR